HALSVDDVVLESDEGVLAQLYVHPLHVDAELGRRSTPMPETDDDFRQQAQRARHGASPHETHLHSSSSSSRPMRAISWCTAARATSLTGPSIQASSSASRRRRPRSARSECRGGCGSNIAFMTSSFDDRGQLSTRRRCSHVHGTCQGTVTRRRGDKF